MRMNVTSHDFVREFDEYNRGDNFSRAGRYALFEWLEDINPNYELDVIAICCEFAEWESLEEYYESYDPEEWENDDEWPDAMVVCGYDGERFITLH